jgi:hypothetical protein
VLTSFKAEGEAISTPPHIFFFQWTLENYAEVRQLIVGEHIGALLRLGPARGDHHRNLGDAELPGGEYPGVARNQPAVLAHQRRGAAPAR